MQTVIMLTKEELLADRQAVAKEAAERAVADYKSITSEQLVPKEKIKAAFGIKDDAAFYRLRRNKGVAAVEIWGNVPVYHLSDFLKA